MDKLEGLSRRDFFKLAINSGACSIYTLLPEDLFAQTNPRDNFKRNLPYGTESLPEILIRRTKSANPISKGEREFDLVQLRKSLNITGKLNYLGSYEFTFVRREPDKKYAENLIKEAKNSIDNIFNFLGVNQKEIPAFKFQIPYGKDEVQLEGNPDVFYLVSDLNYKIIRGYKAIVDGVERIVTITYIDSSRGGSTERSFQRTPRRKGFDIKASRPIFYKTSQDIIFLIETPPIEALHKYFENYTVNHMANGLKYLEPTDEAFNSSLIKHTYDEERFVHALSILWLRKYNKDRKFGFNDEGLNARFDIYEKLSSHRGTNRLAQHISKIGIKKAIELYINDPNELFRGAGVK